jgi:transposase
MGDTRLEPLVLSKDERRTLENWVKRRSTAQGLALRARIVLACAQGGSNVAVAARPGVNRKTVNRWRARFLRERLDGLTDDPRPGVPRTITDAQVEEVVVRTLEEVPGGGTHWSKRELARRAGYLTVQRAADLAGVRAPAVADRDLQGLPGPAAD